MQNYGYNPYLPQQAYQQQKFSPLKILPVSNILEANATPVDSLEPIFFFNKAENVIYKKQIDGTGAAPIQIFKLEHAQDDLSMGKSNLGINYHEENFRAINDRLDELKNLLTSQEEIKNKKAVKDDK